MATYRSLGINFDFLFKIEIFRFFARSLKELCILRFFIFRLKLEIFITFNHKCEVSFSKSISILINKDWYILKRFHNQTWVKQCGPEHGNLEIASLEMMYGQLVIRVPRTTHLKARRRICYRLRLRLPCAGIAEYNHQKYTKINSGSQWLAT